MRMEDNQSVGRENYMELRFPSLSQNESLARVAVAAFVSHLDPTLEVLTEIKTAVSEAVTNAIIHGYEGITGVVLLTCRLASGSVEIVIEDTGRGIDDIDQAKQPLYTTRPELERSGMGITIMESFMDELLIESRPGIGTKVVMRKNLVPAPQRQ